MFKRVAVLIFFRTVVRNTKGKGKARGSSVYRWLSKKTVTKNDENHAYKRTVSSAEKSSVHGLFSIHFR